MPVRFGNDNTYNWSVYIAPLLQPITITTKTHTRFTIIIYACLAGKIRVW